MADDDGPRPVDVVTLIAGHRRSVDMWARCGCWAAGGREPSDELCQRSTDAGLDGGNRFATLRLGVQRSPPPDREDVAPARLDLRAIQAFPFALADLEQAGIRP